MDAAAVEGHDDEVAGFSFCFFFLSSMVTDEGSLNVCAGAGRGTGRGVGWTAGEVCRGTVHRRGGKRSCGSSNGGRRRSLEERRYLVVEGNHYTRSSHRRLVVVVGKTFGNKNGNWVDEGIDEGNEE